MTFHNVEFPLKFRPSSELGPSFTTNLQTTSGGTRYASAVRSKPVNIYGVVPGTLNETEITELIDFYNARRGSLHSFKLTDPFDCSTHSDHRTAPTVADGLVSVGATDGSLDQTFQLKAVYASGGYETERPIVLPDTSTMVLQVDGATKTQGVDYTVNSLTGQVTLTGTYSTGLDVTAGCKFFIPVYFGIRLDRRLAIQGSRALATINAIPILELPNDLPVVDIGYTMGATDWTSTPVTASTAFDVSNGTTQVWLNTTGGGIPILLPAKTSLDYGAELRVKNSSSSTGGLTVRDSDTGTTLSTVSGGSTHHCILSRDSSGNPEWVVVS